MFIAIVGTPAAGKKTVQRYLVEKHGFTVVGLERPSDPMAAAKLSGSTLDVPLARMSVSETPVQTPLETPPLPPTPTSPSTSTSTRSTLPSTGALLDYTTKSWLTNHVTCDLKTYEEVEPFLKRPWFLLVSVDGPLRTRYERVRARSSSSVASTSALTLDEFVDAHDLLLNGPLLAISATAAPAQQLGYQPQTDFSRVQGVAQVKVLNNFASTQGLWAHLDQLDLCNEERLRPGWDTYFMTLASLASHRSNCMKRRVGALLVRSKRILSTGYNGTPRGTRNCNHGGCRRCNGSARGGEALDECLCLHAEENALLEAGRDRTGDDSVLYCNTCPCLRCSVKIVQCGVREVVYNQSYSMDEASAMVLKEGGVVLRQLHLPPGVGL